MFGLARRCPVFGLRGNRPHVWSKHGTWAMDGRPHRSDTPTLRVLKSEPSPASFDHTQTVRADGLDLVRPGPARKLLLTSISAELPDLWSQHPQTFDLHFGIVADLWSQHQARGGKRKAGRSRIPTPGLSAGGLPAAGLPAGGLPSAWISTSRAGALDV